ncbi:amidohydrolase family protein [Streptomyces sp. NPDC059262]|uniref:amidohydrolase family protein n=1 Tax=Streptomyces sp. NPDC059262 TaxID=3346797 RepID=UPI0036B9696B
MSSRKLITAARVVTGPGGRCVEDGAVLTDGDTVVAAGRRAEVEALADERDERIGMPAPRVLDMVTTEAADALGAGGRAGLLAPGCQADLVAVSGDRAPAWRRSWTCGSS